jgi:hypothetical protein
MFKFTYRVMLDDRYFKRSYDAFNGRRTDDPAKAIKWKTREAAERYANSKRSWFRDDIATRIKVVCEITKEEV